MQKVSKYTLKTKASVLDRNRSARCAVPKRRKSRHRNDGRKSRNVTYEPLDGGYGWVVVFGAFFVQFWVAGLVKSYGVLYVEVMETFKDSSASVASWIPAILTCLCLALGESSSRLSRGYSLREFSLEAATSK